MTWILEWILKVSSTVTTRRTHSPELGQSPSECGINIVQFSSVTQLCPTLCDPMDCSTPGFPVHHQLPEFVQIHVHWVSDTIQPSHPLSSPSPRAFGLSTLAWKKSYLPSLNILRVWTQAPVTSSSQQFKVKFFFQQASVDKNWLVFVRFQLIKGNFPNGSLFLFILYWIMGSMVSLLM